MSKHAFFEVQPIPEITDAIERFIGALSFLVMMTAKGDELMKSLRHSELSLSREAEEGLSYPSQA